MPALAPIGGGIGGGANMFQSSIKPLTSDGAGGDGEGGGEDGDDEEDGKLMDQPEVILKNADDKDIILLEVPCKLAKFRAEDKEWADLGKSTFRVSKDPDTNKQRITVRNTMGKILVNSYFFKDMKVEKAKNCVKFNAIVFDSTENKSVMGNYYVKLREADVDNTMSTMEAGKASAK
jgi:hypothetical protein